MARIQIGRTTNGHEPPPSSILATHIGVTNGHPKIDQASFKLLLEAILGDDEQGNPNLGTDLVENHKIVCVVVQAGIEPYLKNRVDDPFRSNGTAGKEEEQLSSCLEALQTSVERCPAVLFVKSRPGDQSYADHDLPLHVWLMPKLLGLMSPEQNTRVNRGVFEIVRATLQADRACHTASGCATMLNFVRFICAGLLKSLENLEAISSDTSMTLTEAAFSSCLTIPHSQVSEILSRLRLRNSRHLIFVCGQLLKAAQPHSTSREHVIPQRKQTQKLRNALEDALGPQIDSNMPQFETLYHELSTLDHTSSIYEPMSVATSMTFDVENETWPDSDRVRKRPRLSTQEDQTEESETYRQSTCKTLTSILAGRSIPDLRGLSAIAPLHFRGLDHDQQCTALTLLGMTACCLSRDANVGAACTVCDAEITTSTPATSCPDGEELLKTLIALKSILARDSKARVPAMSALSRIIRHTEGSEDLAIGKTPSGEWCLQCIPSSSRELRQVAARTLQAFALSRPDIDDTITRQNRMIILEYLQNLWQQQKVPVQEAVVVALVQMAQVVGDDELNIVMLRLVDYLGHPNPYIVGLVVTEIQKLAQALDITIATLFRPFWRTLGVVVAKSLTTNPGVIPQLCELLGMDADQILRMIEKHALPYLVLTKNQDLIGRFAQTHSPPISTFVLCTQELNMITVISYLLAQQYSDPEQAITKLLYAASPEFKQSDLATWISHYPLQIACEVFKYIADHGQGKTSRSYQGVQLLAVLVGPRIGQSSAAKKDDSIGAFLEANVLAIVTLFVAFLNDLEVKEPKTEKRRCLAALGEIVRLGRNRIVHALPQICVCLRSNLQEPDLCNAAFSSWATMIESLKEEDICPLIDQTLALIIKNWDMFDSSTQQRAYNVIADLLKKHTDMIRDIFNELPSLASIPLMSKFEMEIEKLKRQMDERHQLAAFTKRLQNENVTVIEQALGELVMFLQEKQSLVHQSILREQPDQFIADLVRALLNACIKFNNEPQVVQLCGKCLGSIGCLDPSKIETVQERKSIVVIENFTRADETMDFVFFFMEHVLVKCFLSTPNTRAQGFLAWAMQELLKLLDLSSATPPKARTRELTELTPAQVKWNALPEITINILTPFLSSRYLVQEMRPPEEVTYPLYKADMKHRDWLRAIAMDFLNRGPGDNAGMIFREICCRVVYGQDTLIPSFLLPYAALNLVVNGIEKAKLDILAEILNVLETQPGLDDRNAQEELRLCDQTIFEILDYMSKWLQLKRKQHAGVMARIERGAPADPRYVATIDQIKNVEQLLEAIPPDLLSKTAIDCKSYARALFHWEQYMRISGTENKDSKLGRLQEIYAQIDEPDGIEGISAHMHILDVEQQVLEHRKSGRWTTAQSWYEMELSRYPDNVGAQRNLMECLRESGQHDVLLYRLDGLTTSLNKPLGHLASFAIEAAWVTNRWDKLPQLLAHVPRGDFASNIGHILAALIDEDQPKALQLLNALYSATASELTPNNIVSLQTCHDVLLRLHVLDDIQRIATSTVDTRAERVDVLNKRLDILGSYVSDKEYVLGIRRAVMTLCQPTFTEYDVGNSWLTSARLARKARSTVQAFNAVLKASSMGDKSAKIEQAKLMWQEGHHRKAIQTLEGAIDAGIFVTGTETPQAASSTLTAEQQAYQNGILAKANVLLGKWLDQSGQSQSEVIIKTFQKSNKDFRRWEKGWYYLGHYYNKLLDAERPLPPEKASQTFLSGDAAKVVIASYLRSLICGSKYVFQTLPKILTLWFELVSGAEQPQDPRRGNEKFLAHNTAQRKKIIDATNEDIKKYVDKIHPVVLYTVLPQVVARICHSNQTVYNILVSIVVKVVRAFPHQSLWTLLAVIKSHSKDRATRGLNIVSKLIDAQKRAAKDAGVTELRNMITAGQRFSDEVLRVSEFPLEGKVSKVSLARDLGFNHKIAPSRLVVPSESCLIPSIPTSYESAQLKTFRPFAKDPVTISAFLDEALVLSSLQKPRKLSIRGSDGNIYGVLAKPKDDMRKDQRLMEFNTMITRFLKRDLEASKRRLYIRTYAVIPLNEECGLIEWVNNLKTFRDIILKLYKDKNISPNYPEIRTLLDDSCSSPEKYTIFNDKVLGMFPPVFHEWFVESFPDPSAWFNARLRYTRSCAVMSLVGHVLGLGDRHGENILFEEDNGGTLHVDFNCLFDKGLTFEKPECVPFRLTHNMVDAFGAYGYEGPFRHCCEITLSLLRSNEDALMTILETFLHDPTTDFINAGKRKKQVNGVPNTPLEVLDSVRMKVKGMLAGESVPLSVGGYVQEIVSRATDQRNLCRMYIGWCAFL